MSRGDGSLELAVRDDGRAFDVERTLERAASHGNLGLLRMMERVEFPAAPWRSIQRPLMKAPEIHDIASLTRYAIRAGLTSLD